MPEVTSLVSGAPYFHSVFNDAQRYIEFITLLINPEVLTPLIVSLSLDTILSQFHPPPIFTAHFPKIHLTN
jgi:hypothetical protein